MYYCLHNHCKLVKGASRAAIYDLKTGKVHSINSGAFQILNACLDNPIEDLWDLTLPENLSYMEFLNKLCTKELGTFQDSKPTSSVETPSSFLPAKLDFIWLELTSRCNSKCLHCYAECGPSHLAPDEVPHVRWLELIAEAKNAGATAIQLIGGEPLLYSGWQELVKKAYQLNYECIEIFTNGTLIDDECITFFKQHNVSIATTIYANNPETHDKISLHPNSFKKTMTAIRKLLAANIPLRIASIIMKDNEHEVENIIKLYEELGMTDAVPDVVRPTGRGDDQRLLPLHYRKPPIRPPFYIDEESFIEAHHHHKCLAGKLAITATGDVIPCIFARNQLCGNIINDTLATIIHNSNLHQCWHTTKDCIHKCKDCEYRYACSDCRPLAQGSDPTKDWLASPLDCSYDPHTGKWNNSCTTVSP